MTKKVSMIDHLTTPPRACVPDDADCEACSERAQAHCEASSKVSVARVRCVLLGLCKVTVDDDGRDKA